MATCRGIDISTYQGAQNWAAHKADGVAFAFAKASEGQRSRDNHFVMHIEGIIAAGLVPGAYHFGWPTQDPAAEAANYISAVKPYAGPGFVHWLDLERRSDGANYKGRSASQIRAWAAKWIALVAAAFPGQRVGSYTSKSDLAAGHLPTGTTLWYPAYPGTSVDTYAEAEARARPKPAGWSPLIWQFTSTPASGPNLDLNLCYLSESALRAWAGETEAPVTPQEIAAVADAVVAKLLAGGGVLENSDIDRIYAADVIPAARPPYNNPDYYAADGKTPNNVTWSAKYTEQTQTEGIREAVALLKDIKTTLGAIGAGGLADQLKAELEKLGITLNVTTH